MASLKPEAPPNPPNTADAQPTSPQKPCNENGTSSPPQKLYRIIEEQQQEITRLNEYIASLHITTTEPATEPATEPEPQHKCANAQFEVTAIAQSVPALMRGLTTKQDIITVANLCRKIVGSDSRNWQALHSTFFNLIVTTRADMRPEILALEDVLPENWYHEPWYLAYVQYTGVDTKVDSKTPTGDFDSLRKLLPYITGDLGFKNLCLLPHYESPMADGGYDISSYTVRESLGGTASFQTFMNEARAHGMRIATDAVFNHTSTEHTWFQQAIAGNEQYIKYYVQRNGRQKIAEWQQDGNTICQYRDQDGTITERTVAFPDVDRTHGLWVEINGQTLQFYRTFYPFQVDLNLRNGDVLCELLRIVAGEIAAGVLGKRMDGVPHWVKQPGSASDGLEESHAISELFKRFIKHLHKRAITLPEAVREMPAAATYAGEMTSINGESTTREGDAIFAFEMQAALRESTCLQTVAPFWKRVFTCDVLPSKAVWMNVVDHHNEIYMGFFPGEVRRWLSDYIKTRDGIVFKNGRSGGGRLANCLDGNLERISTAIFMQYMAPGVPMMYHGAEIGRGNDWAHARRQMVKAKGVFQKVGVYVDEAACFDGRELHRGPIEREEFVRAVSSGLVVTRVVRRLNELSGCGWWKGELTPVDCDDVGVFCASKRNCGAGDGTQVLCVANLTPLRKEVCVGVRQAERALGVEEWGDLQGSSGFVDLMTGEEVHVRKAGVEGMSVSIGMCGFQRLIVCKRGVEGEVEEEDGYLGGWVSADG